MAGPLLFSCVIFALRGVSVASRAHTNLTFMMIVSYGQHGFNSSGALPAVDMALEDINSNPDILSGYNLMYDKVRDSMVSKLASLGKINTIIFHYKSMSDDVVNSFQAIYNYTPFSPPPCV